MKILARSVVLLLPCFPAAAAETESARLAMLGDASWRAFHCYQLARWAHDEMAGQLFEKGYDAGLEFFEGALAGQVDIGDRIALVPHDFNWLGSGGTANFWLGVGFARTTAGVDYGMKAEGEKLAPDPQLDEILATGATERFKAAHCEALLQ